MRFSRLFFLAAGFIGSAFFLLSVGMRLVGIDDEARVVAKALARRAKAAVYREATIRNPTGDMVPDWIDDVVLGKIREIF